MDVALSPITNLPDHAGLIGCAHLVPPWILSGHDSILAVDIGGSNIRAGIVELNNRKKPDLRTRRSSTSSCGDTGKRSPTATMRWSV